MSNAAAVALAIKVTADTKAAADGLDDTTNKTSKLGKAGNVAGKLLAGGLLVAGAAALKAAPAAADDAAAQVKYATAVKNATGASDAAVASSEAWIAAQGKLYGVTDDELRPALTSLVAATKDVGEAQKLAAIAQNIAAVRGVSLESVTKKLAKAQTNGAAGLAAFGVQTKDAAGKTRDLGAVTKDLATLYKDGAAKEAETTAGKQKILKVQLGELQEEIGTKLIPVLAALATAGLKVVDWISKNQTVAVAIIGTIAALLVVTFAVSKAMAAWSAIVKIASVVQAAFNLVMSANPLVLFVIALVAVGVALVVAYKKSETFRNIVNTAFGAIAKTVGVVVDFIRDHWKLLLAILGGPIGLALALIIGNFDKIKAVVLVVVNFIRDKWTTVKTAIGDVVDGIKTRVSDGFHAILSPIQAVIDKVQAVIDKIKSIPTPKLPDLNPFNNRTSVAGVGRLGARSGTSAASQHTANIYLTAPIADASSVRLLTRELARQNYSVGGAIG